MNSGHNAIYGGNAQGAYSSGGDIILTSSGGTKKKRWPIVVAVLLFLIAIGAGVGAWMMSRPLSGGIKTSFDALNSYLSNGVGFSSDKDIVFENDNRDILYALKISQEDGDVVQSYFEGMDALLEGFVDKAEGTVDSSILFDYVDAVRILRNAVNYRAITDDLILKYSNYGDEDFEKYFDKEVYCENEDDLAKICGDEISYYDAALYEYSIYASAQCIEGEMYLVECAMDYYGDDYLEKVNMAFSSGAKLIEFYNDDAFAEINDGVISRSQKMKEVIR